MFERTITASHLTPSDVDDVVATIPFVVAHERRVHLQVEDGRGFVLRAPVQVVIGPPTMANGVTSWPISWAPTGHGRLLPGFSGHLDARGLESGTLLTLVGVYRPPLGIVGAVLDRAKLRQFAHQSLDGLLLQIDRWIHDELTARETAGGVRLPPYPADFRLRRF